MRQTDKNKKTNKSKNRNSKSGNKEYKRKDNRNTSGRNSHSYYGKENHNERNHNKKQIGNSGYIAAANETEIFVKDEYLKKYLNGYPLILEEALENPEALKKEGQIVVLKDSEKNFLGKGYFGRQNKGSGWILSTGRHSVFDDKFFYDKLRNAFSKRLKLYHSRHTNAFRVFNGEGDGIGGLTIDYYNEYYLITWYSPGIYVFKNSIIKAMKSLVSVDGIYEKKRFEENGMVVDEDSFVEGKHAPEPLVIKENNVNFAVYLNDGAMTGIFLDQKDVRRAIKEKYSKDKTVLNTFSYTGAFSMAAAKGGAHTTSVDLASRSLEKTEENFRVNGINPETQEIVVEDIFKYFKQAAKEEKKFDVVILDPPSFATSKDNRFSASQDYKDLVKDAIKLNNNEGIIVASTNCAAFNMNKFKRFIDDAYYESDAEYEILEEHTLPEDFAVTEKFPEGNYLKVLILKTFKK